LSEDPHRTGCIYFLNEISEYEPLKKTKGETVKNRQPVFDKDLVHLEFAIRRHDNLRLVVIDSLPTLCPDKKTYRAALRRLEEIARRRGVAILATARPSTRSRGRVQVTGDRLSEDVRCLFNVLRDPEDIQRQRRFLAPVRMNFSEEPEWLAFRIVSGIVAWETPTDGVPLSSCVAGPTEQKAAVLHEVMDWLRETLKDEDLSATAATKQARERGFSAATLRRACEKLEVRHVRCYFGPIGYWVWTLKPKPPEGETARAAAGQQAKPGRQKRGTRHANGRQKDPTPSRPSELPGGLNLNAMSRALIREALARGLAGDEPSSLAGKSRGGRKTSTKGDYRSNGHHSSNGRPRKPR
jgi:hypothetical protein